MFYNLEIKLEHLSKKHKMSFFINSVLEMDINSKILVKKNIYKIVTFFHQSPTIRLCICKKSKKFSQKNVFYLSLKYQISVLEIIGTQNMPNGFYDGLYRFLQSVSVSDKYLLR